MLMVYVKNLSATQNNKQTNRLFHDNQCWPALHTMVKLSP